MAKVKDEIGNRYKKLFVAGFSHFDKGGEAWWNCVCDCGSQKKIKGTNLRNGNTKSCGCGKRDIDRSKDISGKRFGRLIVIKRIGTKIYKNGFRAAIWLCRCDCGETTQRTTGSLGQPKKHSCGCSSHGKLPEGVSAFNSLYKRLESSAKNRGYSWELSKNDVERITSQPCFYCGNPPSQVAKARSRNGQYIYNGIDRVDNVVGYVKYNVVPCCWKCNDKKKAMPVDVFRNWIVRVYSHWASRS